MKSNHTHYLDKIKKIEHPQLISLEELEANQQKVMRQIEQLPTANKSRPISVEIKWMIGALCAACIAGVLILTITPENPTLQNNINPEIAQNEDSTNALIETTNFTKPNHEYAGYLTETSSVEPTQSKSAEELWIEITTEEMEMFLIDEEEF